MSMEIERKPVRTSTTTLLAFWIFLAWSALSVAALVLDSNAEVGSGTDRTFSTILGMQMGPLMILFGIGMAVVGRRTRSLANYAVALGALAFGALMTWLYFFETTEVTLSWF